MIDATQKLSFLKDKAWWLLSLAHLRVIAPDLILPTALLIAGNVILLYAQAYSQSVLDNTSRLIETDLVRLTTVCMIAFGLSLVGLIVIFWSMSVWLARLSAYARTLWPPLQGSVSYSKNESGIGAIGFNRADFQQNIKSVMEHKAFYGKFWFWLSLFCIPPILPLAVIGTLRVILASPLLRSEIPGFEQLILPPVMVLGIDITILFLSSIMMGLMFWSTIYCGLEHGRSRLIAYRAFTSFFGNSDTLLFLSFVATLFFIIFGQPQIVFAYAMGNLNMDFGFAINLFWQVWLALICLVSWPILLRAYLEIFFYDSVENSGNVNKQ